MSAQAAFAADSPPDSDWSQATIQEADGTQLHADVLRPKGLPKEAKTPVILSIGPYFNHSGQTGPAGPLEDTPYDPTTSGPSDRFYDFVNGAHLMQRGYTYVMVDLRGFGGSTGCLDWAGPGEQADVKSAVEWAASQPWSTGKVGMYGKSYDAVTGLLGIVQQPKGLSAVVAQEPVYDLYRYLYMNGVRYLNSLATPALYDAIAGTPGTASDDLSYDTNALNDTSRPGCPALNWADQQDPNHASDYWKPRNLIAGLKGKRTPLFMTQGLLENNTKPDGAADAFNAVSGSKRGWFGMWEHVRGNDTDANGRLRMGRKGWFDEVMRFYDLYLKGQSSAVQDPQIAVETNDGKWRAETAWPPRDAYPITAPLKAGSYADDGQNNGSGADGGTPPYGEGVWTFSPILDNDAHLSGTPTVTVDAETQAANANLIADVYDVDQNNKATLISRGAYLLPGSGKVSYKLYDQDWKFPAGHRLGVLLTGTNAEWWTGTPTQQTVTVKNASISLPFLSCERTDTIQGDPSIRLEDYLKTAPFDVDPATIASNTEASFPLPGPQASDCSKAELAGGAATPAGSKRACVDRRKFAFRIHQPKGGRITKATAYVNGKRKASKKGRRGKAVKSITLKRLPQKTFTVKIVAQQSNGKQTVSVRRYKGCKKGKPRTTVRHHRHR